MTTLTIGRASASFVLSEAAGMRSRDQGVLAASQDVEPGQPLARVLAAAGIEVTSAADAGNTGTGALTLAVPAYTSAARPGRYRAVCIEPATDGGTFAVYAPSGAQIGKAVVGVAFAKQVKFTIADSTDFVAGDAFSIDVDLDAGGEQLKAWNPAAADGTEIPSVLPLYAGKTGAGETLALAVIARDCEVLAKEIFWPAGTTAEQKETALAQLADHGVIAR